MPDSSPAHTSVHGPADAVPTPQPSSLPPRILFSDLDGTLIHYTDTLRDVGLFPTTSPEGLWRTSPPPLGSALTAPLDLLPLPPTASGSQGFISTTIFERLARLRARQDVRLVLISGARAGTLLQRLPLLPAADAYVCESGGRIFYPGAVGWAAHTAAPLTEDHAWRGAHEPAAGPAVAAAMKPERRGGPLWTLFAALSSTRHARLQFDCRGYSTAFRVRGDAAALAEIAGSLPGSLACARNLGALDVYPATSGKVSAARHLAARWGADLSRALFLCDDDNDLELAAAVGRAFLPSITSESMGSAARAGGDAFYVARMPVPWSTEEVLEAVEAELAPADDHGPSSMGAEPVPVEAGSGLVEAGSGPVEAGSGPAGAEAEPQGAGV
ncbi:hypothetical protein ACKKBG_A24400 [Auxenochlorella protothecoides x Auxenochlorella symbiontica]